MGRIFWNIKKCVHFTYKSEIVWLGGMPDRKQILLVLSAFSFQNKLLLSISISATSPSAGIKVVSFTKAFRNEWLEKTQVNNLIFCAIQFHYDCAGWIMTRISQLLTLCPLYDIKSWLLVTGEYWAKLFTGFICTLFNRLAQYEAVT